MKIALFRHAQVKDLEHITQEKFFEYTCDQYVQVSEPIEVDFVMLPKEVFINKQINALKEQKRLLLIDAEIKAKSLDDQIANLLAITQES